MMLWFLYVMIAVGFAIEGSEKENVWFAIFCALIWPMFLGAYLWNLFDVEE